MHVALDATYLVDPHPSGISVYSRELLDGLAIGHPDDFFLHYYRLKQYRRAARPPCANIQQRLLLPWMPAVAPWRRPPLFHALNQRVDKGIAKRVISTFHDLFVMTGEYSSLDFRARFTRRSRDAAAASDLIIAVSEFTKQQVISCLGVEASRVRVVPHGVHAPTNVSPLDAREKIILCVGALQLRKNVTRLVQAFERVPDSVSAGWSLVLAGSTAGYGANDILRYIESSAKRQQIQLPGYVSAQELDELYRRALVFAFPSLDEGFGIPVLEAMAHGIPVVTSNRSALPEVAGDAALLVDPYNVDELSAALAVLMTQSEVRRDLRVRGLQRAALFPWHQSMAATYRLYREVVA